MTSLEAFLLTKASIAFWNWINDGSMTHVYTSNRMCNIIIEHWSLSRVVTVLTSYSEARVVKSGSNVVGDSDLRADFSWVE